MSSCSSLHFSFPNCPHPRLPASAIPKASQTPAGPHSLRAGAQTQLPAFQALDTNLLCCSAICASLKAECRKKSYIRNPSLQKQMPLHLKAQRITSSARFSAEKYVQTTQNILLQVLGRSRATGKMGRNQKSLVSSFPFW